MSEKAFRWDILINPGKYKESIKLEKIVAAPKVYSEGVDRYKRKISTCEDIGTIVVVKHPREDLYAVLDGHHRYWAKREMAAIGATTKDIECAVIPDLLGLLFYLTKEGALQPPEEFTRYIRVPLMRLMDYLNEFLDNPGKLLRDIKRIIG